MIELIVSVLFLFWFIISLTYCFKASFLGSIGKWLHRYGWLNQWSMYTQHSMQNEGGEIYYRDVETKNDKTVWVSVLKPKQSVLFVINKEARLQFFYNKCYKKLLHEAKKSDEVDQNFPFFKYLCAVIIEIPHNPKNKFRQVKIVRFSANKERKPFLQSDFIPFT